MVALASRSLGLSAFGVALVIGSGLLATGNAAGNGPVGTWIDQTGEGAIRISECAGKLCGHLIWLKSAQNGKGCNLEILGNVAALGDGKWGGGWIFDPDTRKKFSVEITPDGEQKLKVLGYAGVKTFGRTMTWTKAPDDLKPCSEAAPALVTAQNQAGTASTPKMAAAPMPSAPAVEIVPSANSVAGTTSEKAETKAVAEALNTPGATAPAPRKQHREAANTKRRGSHAKEFQVSDLNFDDVKFRRSRGGACSLTLGDFGRLAFPC